MAKGQKEPARAETTSASQSNEPTASAASGASCLAAQGWVGIALWMTLGLLLEGLIAYRAPAYLGDTQRRELFRLAHAHGTLFGVLLLLAAWCSDRFGILPRAAELALRIGTVLMPLGFLLAGMWHPEGDPGWAIVLAPLGALLVIFGAVALALRVREK